MDLYLKAQGGLAEVCRSEQKQPMVLKALPSHVQRWVSLQLGRSSVINNTQETCLLDY